MGQRFSYTIYMSNADFVPSRESGYKKVGLQILKRWELLQRVEFFRGEFKALPQRSQLRLHS